MTLWVWSTLLFFTYTSRKGGLECHPPNDTFWKNDTHGIIFSEGAIPGMVLQVLFVHKVSFAGVTKPSFSTRVISDTNFVQIKETLVPLPKHCCNER
jgi:hypothetical protein